MIIYVRPKGPVIIYQMGGQDQYEGVVEKYLGLKGGGQTFYVSAAIYVCIS